MIKGDDTAGLSLIVSSVKLLFVCIFFYFISFYLIFFRFQGKKIK